MVLISILRSSECPPIEALNDFQGDISQIIGVTEVTLRSRYKELLKGINFKLF